MRKILSNHTKNKLERKNYFKSLFSYVFKKKDFIISLVILTTIFIAGLVMRCSKLFENLYTINLEKAFLPPSLKHIFGTNEFGQDMFYLVITGSFNTLCFSIFITITNIIIGTIIGIMWGNNQKLDLFIIFLKGILNNIPLIFIYILFIFFFGINYHSLFIIIILIGWIDVACLVRNNLIIIRNKDYNTYSKLAKTPFLYKALNNYLPAILPVIFHYFALSIPQVISIEVNVSYISFPVSNGYSSLGMLVYSSIYDNNCMMYPHLIIFPLIFLVIINMCVYKIGKSLSAQSVFGGESNAKS